MTHGNIKPFKCTVCDVGFTRKEHLKVHVNKQHSPTEIAAAKSAAAPAGVKESAAAPAGVKEFAAAPAGVKEFAEAPTGVKELAAAPAGVKETSVGLSTTIDLNDIALPLDS